MTKARDLADFVSAGNPLADGTIDVADINGITATTAELNYTDGVTSNIQTQLDAKLPLSGGTMTGDVTFSGTQLFDGRDVSADGTTLDGLPAAYQSYTDTAIANLVDTAPSTLDTLNELAAALGDDPNFATTVTNSIATKVAKAGDTMTGDLAFGDNVKATYGAGADLQIYHDGSNSLIRDTGTGDLQLRGSHVALMDAGGNHFIYCTDTGTGGTVEIKHLGATKLATTSTGVDITGNIAVTGTVDGRDVAADGTKLDGIEAGADVTDTANVTAAGALMDSELTNITAVKALNQGVSTTDSPTFNTVTLTGNLDMQDGDKIALGTSDDLQLYHDGTRSWVVDNGAGDLRLSTVNGAEIALVSGVSNEYMLQAVRDGAVTLYYDNNAKLATTANGVTITGSVLATTDIFTTGGGTITLDFSTRQNFIITLDRNITLANPTTEQVGQSGFITFIHSGAGRTVSLGSDYETAGGAGLTLSATSGATDVIPYIVAASGRILLGTPQLAFS